MKSQCESADLCKADCKHKKPHAEKSSCKADCDNPNGIPGSRCKPVEPSARIIGEGSARLLGVDLDLLPVGGGA
jgi:hypothetical protein